MRTPTHTFRSSTTGRCLSPAARAYRAARHAARGADLMCVYYERELEKDVDELRDELRIERLPELT